MQSRKAGYHNDTTTVSMCDVNILDIACHGYCTPSLSRYYNYQIYHDTIIIIRNNLSPVFMTCAHDSGDTNAQYITDYHPQLITGNLIFLVNY